MKAEAEKTEEMKAPSCGRRLLLPAAMASALAGLGLAAAIFCTQPSAEPAADDLSRAVPTVLKSGTVSHRDAKAPYWILPKKALADLVEWETDRLKHQCGEALDMRQAARTRVLNALGWAGQDLDRTAASLGKPTATLTKQDMADAARRLLAEPDTGLFDSPCP